jgi:long-chain fatty acid transport protein
MKRESDMKKFLPFLCGFVLVMAAAAPLHAGGFAVTEIGAAGLGSAYAGSAAVAADAATIYWNPAGMARLDGRQGAAALIVSDRSYEFTASGTATNALGQPIQPLGANGGDAGQTLLLPGLFYSHSLSDRLKVGIDLVVPFNIDSEYDSLWVGRYYAVKSELLTYDINPAVAYRINARWSLGAGISAQYLDVELNRAVDFGWIDTFNGYGLGAGVPSTPLADGNEQVSGDDWGYGFNLGVLLELSEATRFGLSYRSKIEHSIDGRTAFTYPATAPTIGTVSGLVNQNVKLDIDLPASAALSGYHRFDRWALTADLTWTQWSSLDQLRIDYANAGVADDVTTLDWDDTWRFAAGVNWFYTDEWTWRAGLAYDQTPVSSAALQTPIVPDEDSLWLSLGGSWQFDENWGVDFGGAYIWTTDDPQINRTTATLPDRNENTFRGNLSGTYDVTTYILGAQLNFNF